MRASERASKYLFSTLLNTDPIRLEREGKKISLFSIILFIQYCQKLLIAGLVVAVAQSFALGRSHLMTVNIGRVFSVLFIGKSITASSSPNECSLAFKTRCIKLVILELKQLPPHAARALLMDENLVFIHSLQGIRLLQSAKMPSHEVTIAIMRPWRAEMTS